jgi:hypothetical protein
MFKDTIRLYGEKFVDELFSVVLNKISQEVSNEADAIFLAQEENRYVQKLVEKYSLDIPIIEFDKAYVKIKERDIPASRFPAEFAVFEGKSYKKEVIVYHLPYSGDIDILTFKPNPFSTFYGYELEIDRTENCFLFEFIKFYDDPEQIKRKYEDSIRYITRDYGNIFSNCSDFNLKLESEIIRIIEIRKQKLDQRGKFLSSLGVEIRSEMKEEKTSTVVKNIKPNKDKPNYDLAISFAGEDRQIARSIADKLVKLDYSVFYDEYEKVNLWGKNLYDHLSEVYGKKAKYCLMIISKSYAEKHWTNHERQAAQAKAFTQNREYILPLRLDNTEIPGLNITVGYVDYHKTGLDDTINLLRQKIDS